MKISWLAVFVGFCAGFVATLILSLCVGVQQAHAQPDPHWPQPPLWCPGNPPGVSSSGYGAYCEGISYPDGTRWNAYRMGYFWQPLRCIIPNGTPFPELAPNGCGT